MNDGLDIIGPSAMGFLNSLCGKGEFMFNKKRERNWLYQFNHNKRLIKSIYSIYILVYYDKETKGTENAFTEYLESRGFRCTAGFWGCPWYFVEINKREYKPGRPGVCYGEILGNRAITFKEFKKVLSIYDKDVKLCLRK